MGVSFGGGLGGILGVLGVARSILRGSKSVILMVMRVNFSGVKGRLGRTFRMRN